MITETDELGEALEKAAKIWPELAGQRTQLLRRILEVGSEQIEQRVNEAKSERLKQIQNLAGALSGAWPANWREEMAADWPR